MSLWARVPRMLFMPDSFAPANALQAPQVIPIGSIRSTLPSKEDSCTRSPR